MAWAARVLCFVALVVGLSSTDTWSLNLRNTGGRTEFDDPSAPNIGAAGDLHTDSSDGLHGKGTAILVKGTPPINVVNIRVRVTRPGHTAIADLTIIDPATKKPMTFPVAGRAAQKTLPVPFDADTSTLPGGNLVAGDTVEILVTTSDSAGHTSVTS